MFAIPESLDLGAAYRESPVHPGRRGYPRSFDEGIEGISTGRSGRWIAAIHLAMLAAHARDPEGRLMYAETDREDWQKAREAVARMWIRKARKLGLLESARAGVAGDIRPGECPERDELAPNRRKEEP